MPSQIGGCSLIVNVWLIYKAGEPRVYTSTYRPADDQVACFERDGFKLFRAEVNLPVDDALPITVTAKKVSTSGRPPIRMTIHCPVCSFQHIDRIDATTGIDWSKTPHRTHLCSHCGHKWRPELDGHEYTVGV